MKNPVLYYLERPHCNYRTGKSCMVSEQIEKYSHTVFTTKAISKLIDELQEIVAEANKRYPRNRPYHLITQGMSSKLCCQLCISDGTDNYPIWMMFHPVEKLYNDNMLIIAE